MVERKNIVVTGANGLVGAEVLSYLAAKDVNLTAFVRSDSVNRFPNVNYVQGDLSDEIIPNFFPGKKFILIHLASLVKANALKDYQAINLDGTLRLLKATEGRLTKIIYGSSMSVYGQGPFSKILENTKLLPETDLANSRLQAEEAIKAYAIKHSIPFYLLRPRFLFGINDRETLPALIKLHKKGLIAGDGSQKFSFIALPDYAQIIAHIALENNDISGAINIAYQLPLSLNDMYEALGPLKKRRKIPVKLIMSLGKILPPLKKLRIKMQLIGQDQILDVMKLYTLCPFMNEKDEKKIFHEIVAAYMRHHEIK